MPRWRRVVPKVRQIQTERVQELAVPAVVLHVPAAMAALRDWEAHPIKVRRVALSKIQQRIVRWIKLSAAREGSLHGNRDPMPECHFASFEVSSEMECPSGHVIDKDRTPRLQNPNALVNPPETPVQVLARIEMVFILAVPVVLRQVEWRIGENHIDSLGSDPAKQVHAICVVDRPESGGKCRHVFRHSKC